MYAGCITGAMWVGDGGLSMFVREARTSAQLFATDQPGAAKFSTEYISHSIYLMRGKGGGLFSRPPDPTESETQRFYLYIPRLDVAKYFSMIPEKVPPDEIMTVYDICDIRSLAISLLEKCTVDPDAHLYNGEDGQPWNVNPVFTVRTLVNFSNYIHRFCRREGASMFSDSCPVPFQR